MAKFVVWGLSLKRQRLRPEQGAKPPSESAWGWGPKRSQK